MQQLFALLQNALRSNPKGVVLFSSTNPARVTANAQVAEAEVPNDKPMLQFENFIDEILQPGLIPSSAKTSSTPLGARVP